MFSGSVLLFWNSIELEWGPTQAKSRIIKKPLVHDKENILIILLQRERQKRMDSCTPNILYMTTKE